MSDPDPIRNALAAIEGMLTLHDIPANRLFAMLTEHYKAKTPGGEEAWQRAYGKAVAHCEDINKLGRKKLRAGPMICHGSQEILFEWHGDQLRWATLWIPLDE